MREREFEVFGEKLLDIGALDIIGLLDLDNFEDLCSQPINGRAPYKRLIRKPT